ncbi:hypothetical protein [Shimazuella kribbensis]|uniref:hypothetical protein n=1 Tax=Shimazuella kribbensis TaxID=139808 RepID=UPI0012EBB173|nr:hypothetical protein [Shimazuella kribbensis]
MEQIIRPEGKFVVRLPEGTAVNFRQGVKVYPYREMTKDQKWRHRTLMKGFTGTRGIVTPATFDNRLDQEMIVIVNGQITGRLDRTEFQFKWGREELGLGLPFTNQPVLISVRGGDISEHTFAGHRVIGKIDPDTRYWGLVERSKDRLVTVPGKLLNGDHAASSDPLAANRIASLSETGINPSMVTESAVYVSFERYHRPGGRLVHLGDVNFVSSGECSLTVPEVIAGFGADPHTESLVFVEQSRHGVRKLCMAVLNTWPNLVPLLMEDLKHSVHLGW